MHRYNIKNAAQLARASYSATSHPSIKPLLRASLDKRDVQAHLLKNGILLIPGSNSLMDYLRYNLRVLRIGAKKYRMSNDKTEALNGVRWHQGFLAHAKVIQDWVAENNFKVKYIIGHSLGAAAAQILSRSWRVPAIGFAAPRPCRKNAPRPLSPLCLCINRSDDGVCALPSSFHHSGQVKECKARGSVFSPDHSMRHYVKAVAETQAAGKLMKNWPR